MAGWHARYAFAAVTAGLPAVALLAAPGPTTDSAVTGQVSALTPTTYLPTATSSPVASATSSSVVPKAPASSSPSPSAPSPSEAPAPPTEVTLEPVVAVSALTAGGIPATAL